MTSHGAQLCSLRPTLTSMSDRRRETSDPPHVDADAVAAQDVLELVPRLRHRRGARVPARARRRDPRDQRARVRGCRCTRRRGGACNLARGAGRGPADRIARRGDDPSAGHRTRGGGGDRSRAESDAERVLEPGGGAGQHDAVRGDDRGDPPPRASRVCGDGRGRGGQGARTSADHRRTGTPGGVLADLARRRNAGRAQIEQLREGQRPAARCVRGGAAHHRPCRRGVASVRS